MHMISKTILGLGAVALTATASIAGSPPASGKDDANKQICRTVQEIGSRLSKTRACHTKAEWAELRRQSRQTLERIQNSRPADLSR